MLVPANNFGPAARVRDLNATNDSDIAGLQEKIDECRKSSREARETITQLQQKAGVASTDELRISIQRSDDMRKLNAELDRLTAALTQDGDGLSVAELCVECSGIDLDAITAKDQTITEEVQELRNRQMEAREARNTARKAFEAIGGDDRAARDAADRQAALAEMTEIAEQYVRVRSAVVLLEWAIDRYRREKQAPMLKRAGELFAILTCGSFQTLQLEFDEHDNARLAGIRQDGRRVTVSGDEHRHCGPALPRAPNRCDRGLSRPCRAPAVRRTICSSTSTTSARRQASASWASSPKRRRSYSSRTTSTFSRWPEEFWATRLPELCWQRRRARRSARRPHDSSRSSIDCS
ncbi:hypothetical protein JJC00_32420 [Bradyrhizobium diazoefficiens]|uniref:ATP-binding protein n=1 Tax=Bradyrhizobium diazoefficiens TaxID=1355477 RepID=UPI00190DDB39|nr:hypothetical protein [Bradyrhizobium diazoefficiens]QQO37930.1 hypothetical protein JJC00_32420 [Bradyrhizobium diazoefficiens]